MAEERISTCEGISKIFVFYFIEYVSQFINRCTIHSVYLFLNLVVGRCKVYTPRTFVPIYCDNNIHIREAMYIVHTYGI